MKRISITLTDELSSELKQFVGKKKRWKTMAQFFLYLAHRYIDETATRKAYARHGMALSLDGKPLDLDEKTKKKMRKALGLEDAEGGK